MKVTSGNDQILFRENQRIIGYAVYFGQDDFRNMVKRIQACTMHLWNAPEGVGILNVLFRLRNKFASLQQVINFFGHLTLTMLRPDVVNLWKKGFDASVKSIQRQRADQVTKFEQPFGVEQAPDSVCTHKLCAVQ